MYVKLVLNSLEGIIVVRMTGKERFMTAMRLEEPDRVPLFDFLFNPEIFKTVLDRFPPQGAEDWVKCTKKLGLDALWLAPDAPEGFRLKSAGKPGTFYDEWGIVCAAKETSWPIPWIVDYPFKNAEKIEEFEPPDPYAPGRTKTIEKAVKLAGEDMAVIGGIGGPFSNTYMLFGFTTYSICLFQRPSIIHKAAEMITHFNIEVGKRMIDAGVDVVIISDDLGTSDSLMISPKNLKEFVFPYLRRMVSELKKKDVIVSMHSDGDINAVIPDLVKIGIDALHPLQRKAHMNIAEIKEKYGNCLCLMGNVDVTGALSFGSMEEIVRETKECIKIASPGGGHILASDHSLTGISTDRAKTMFDAARTYGKYPIKA